MSSPIIDILHGGNVKMILGGFVMGILGIAFAAASPSDRRGTALLLGLLYGIPGLTLVIHGGHRYWSSLEAAHTGAPARAVPVTREREGESSVRLRETPAHASPAPASSGPPEPSAQEEATWSPGGWLRGRRGPAPRRAGQAGQTRQRPPGRAPSRRLVTASNA